MEWLLVAIGGGIGASLRYSVILLMKKYQQPGEWAIALANLIGSLIMGIAASHLLIKHSLGLFIMVGFLGGFTTFSTFSFDIFFLMHQQKWMKLFLYMVVNLIGGILFFLLGFSYL